jgi:hypothetical protein
LYEVEVVSKVEPMTHGGFGFVLCFINIFCVPNLTPAFTSVNTCRLSLGIKVLFLELLALRLYVLAHADVVITAVGEHTKSSKKVVFAVENICGVPAVNHS